MTSAVEEKYQREHEKYLAKRKKLKRKIAKARLFNIRIRAMQNFVDEYQGRYELLYVPVILAITLITVGASYLFNIALSPVVEAEVVFSLVVALLVTIKQAKVGFKASRNTDKQ